MECDFLTLLNSNEVHACEYYGVMINNKMVEHANCANIKTVDNNRAFRIINYKDKYYRQNGYYQTTREMGTLLIFDEQDWYEVKPVQKVIYEYS